jgi:hypothetical protein
MKKSKIIIAIIALATWARTSFALPADGYRYNPNLTPGENVIREANWLEAHPVEYAQLSTNASGGVTLTPPGGQPVPLPPQSASYSNTTVMVLAGTLTLGAGQHTSLQTYLETRYNFNQHVALGVRGEFGAANDLNAGSVELFGRKVFSDNFEGYAGGFFGRDFANVAWFGGLEVGVMWVPLPATISTLGIHAAFQERLEGGATGESTASVLNKPSTGIIAGACYRF